MFSTKLPKITKLNLFGTFNKNLINPRHGAGFEICLNNDISTTAKLNAAKRSKKTQKGVMENYWLNRTNKLKKKIEQKKKIPIVEAWYGITVKDLASQMNRPIDDVFEAMIYIEDADDYEYPNSKIYDNRILTQIAKKCGFRLIQISAPYLNIKSIIDDKDLESEIRQKPAKECDLVARPPIVTIMGHVDHGKTTLLDYLQKSSIVNQEFGGITQHIGAFSVQLDSSNKAVTFLDTPGHAAFKAMRSRGANVTDIVVLVIAADDGIMDQTLESLEMANAAQVPIVIAINKIDKPGADVDGTKKMLSEYGIEIEDFGGHVQCVPISALKGTNIRNLIEAILTQADVMNIRCAKIRENCHGFI